MVQVWRAEIWPISTLLSSDLQEVLGKLKQFRHCSGTSDCGCADLSYDLDIGYVISFLERELKGLCLKCVRKGRMTVDEGNCSQPKEHLCKG